ncbi:biotin--[acetyl-CoA-carboxylase] ligase [Granulicatella seriolae]|uniref:Bifunctional ligase/repressor BirA n=1 Tax=Granulicatella seriolae TaxID=2967226 RepID=A0ABT1WM16_9LACT|nr:biotin--[acetyl-CoA-carboxylase] ligase [Granulicatella seriolae]
MNTRQQVLTYLEAHRDSPISGQKLADDLNLSRNAIWKAIQSLRQEGYVIESAPNLGYRLADSSDWLHEATIRKNLSSLFDDWDLECFKTIDSTNTQAKAYANNGQSRRPKIFISEEQTLGRGRVGRPFFSPAQTGLYMTICLFPNSSLEDMSLMTAATAVAVAKAIESVTTLPVGIKWVNDIYMGGKKIAGILTEAVTDLESQEVVALIIGIGLNVYPPKEELPEELRSVVGSIFEGKSADFSRNQLAVNILNEWMSLYHQLDAKTVLEDYRQRSIVLGKEVTVIQGNREFQAFARSINDQGHLIVEDHDQQQHELSYGEVSIRNFL